jgi:hypothetical protein
MIVHYLDNFTRATCEVIDHQIISKTEWSKNNERIETYQVRLDLKILSGQRISAQGFGHTFYDENFVPGKQFVLYVSKEDFENAEDVIYINQTSF